MPKTWFLAAAVLAFGAAPALAQSPRPATQPRDAPQAGAPAAAALALGQQHCRARPGRFAPQQFRIGRVQRPGHFQCSQGPAL